jgi:general secretion pathway protein A
MGQALGLDSDAAAYWGLAGMPFNADPRVAVTLPSSQHAEALARVEYLAARGHGCGAVAGPRGSGKSWLLATAAAALQRVQRTVCAVDAAGLDELRLLSDIAAGLGLGLPPATTPLTAWQATCDALRGYREIGEPLVLLIDHVEQMHESGVRAVARLLRNPDLSSGIVVIWSATAPLTGVIWSELWPLAELRIGLNALKAGDTTDYIQLSLRQAGGSRTIFDADALESVYSRTGGELRRVNRLCQFSLLAAMADEQPAVSRDLVEAAAVEFA